MNTKVGSQQASLALEYKVKLGYRVLSRENSGFSKLVIVNTLLQ